MTTMTPKIKVDPNYPFYQVYHDNNYILRHDCSKNVPIYEPKEKREYRLLNKKAKEIVIYKIDGGLVKGNSCLKCDYAIYTEDNWLFLIELKGTDIDHALKQLNSTIDILLKRPCIKVKELKIRIVLSKVPVPRISSSKEKIFKQRLHKLYRNWDYIKRSRTLEDSI